MDGWETTDEQRALAELNIQLPPYMPSLYSTGVVHVATVEEKTYTWRYRDNGTSKQPPI